MDLTPTHAQQDIADSIDEYLTNEMPTSRLRGMIGPAGHLEVDDRTWRKWAEFGFFSLGIPEADGGLGLGLIEEVLVFTQFGRHLTPGPLLSTVLAAHLAQQAGMAELTDDLLSGAQRAALRVGDLAFGAHDGGLLLSVSAAGALLERVATVEPAAGVDPLTAVARVTPGEEVARVSGSALQIRGWLLTGALLLGLAEATERQSTEYAKVRQQFGHPIGSFQAVKHRCADMATRSYAASSQLHLATLFVLSDRPDARFQAACALTLALDAARENTAVNIQNHGGIGFTSEHDAGLYLKRAVAVEAGLGPATERVEATVEPRRTVFA